MLKRTAKMMMLVVLVIQLCGCVAAVVGAGAGVGTYAFVSGKLNYTFDKPVLVVHGATLRALKDMKMSITEDRSDKIAAVVKSKFADGEGVHIEINSQTAQTSTISVRVGVLGDEKRSLAILDEIKKKL
ncbi:MAG: DUF3568 family protein [Nitrospirae bacterium]|uniref:DUF3568 family protein n=1 Tax=Candidatus Magnetobacterium casense TaxID=1455061 RepID=UPI000590661C|nr:DUF3568 family protein [Candidatus Magnetobacterium casensis]MBF0339105.1 DUF3568 family protein [Nitrospirota bacterium]